MKLWFACQLLPGGPISLHCYEGAMQSAGLLSDFFFLLMTIAGLTKRDANLGDLPWQNGLIIVYLYYNINIIMF